MKRAAACGAWPSPLSAAGISAAGVRLSQPRVVGDRVYWLESRPAELGRGVLVCARQSEAPRDLTPAPLSVRSRVHEYGGGAYTVGDDAIYFVNADDQQIYRQATEGGTPRVLTHAPSCRFADLILDERHARLICVQEDHRVLDVPARNTLVAIALADGIITPLAEGYDFFSSPALSPDGQQLAWLCWNNPRMPWDGCELWHADLDTDGALLNSQRVAGGTEESIFQPLFAPNAALHFISDRSGFWNIYKSSTNPSASLSFPRKRESSQSESWTPASPGNGSCISGTSAIPGGRAGVTDKSNAASNFAGIFAVTQDAMDYGFAQWNFGMSSYGFLADGTLLATRIHDGACELVIIGATGQAEVVNTGLSQIEHLHAAGSTCALLGASPTAAMAVFCGTPPRFRPLTSNNVSVPDAYISKPEFLRFPTSQGETACAWYYPPCHPDCGPTPGERPPLLVKCHGGPTAMNGNGLDTRIQFWTSRGFAVADVNYRGSSGFGRTYRESLHGAWGIKDAEDCIAVARHLAERGLVDAQRVAISGGSAGGFTVLCALAFHDYFKAGAVYYGLSELETAMRDTHKFEAHYGDSLLGPWPEAREVYHARSPLFAAGQIRCPVIFFQGLKDKVVPPDQTERMVQALRENGVPVEYLSFPEEGHGFRRRDTLQRTLTAELEFYGRVFSFTPAGEA